MESEMGRVSAQAHRPMPLNPMRKIYASDNIIILGHVRQVLENHAIGCIVRNDFLLGGAGEIPINETWPEVWITDDGDFERARALVDAVVAETDASDPPWRCASCGEQVEGQFTDCWCCGAPGPEPGG